MSTDPKTLDLDEIDARAAHLHEYGDPTDTRIAGWEELAGTDVPALVAEVRRLQEIVTELWARVDDAGSLMATSYVQEALGPRPANCRETRNYHPDRDQPAAETRPRCPHCRLPHDLTPGSMAVRACTSISASIAKAEQLHAEGDHRICAAVNCEVVRDRRAQQDGATR